MKMHWGNALILVFLLFGGLILFLVYKSMNTEFSLVSKEYYKDELAYQSIIDGKKNAAELTEPIALHEEGNQFKLQVPASFKQSDVSGTIWFYCPTDDSKDVKKSIVLNETGSMTIDKSTLSKGDYQAKIQLTHNKTPYYLEKAILIK